MAKYTRHSLVLSVPQTTFKTHIQVQTIVAIYATHARTNMNLRIDHGTFECKNIANTKLLRFKIHTLMEYKLTKKTLLGYHIYWGLMISVQHQFSLI
jgi:hypothetical protein